MGKVNPQPVGGVCTSGNSSVNGGSSGVLTTCVFQPIDTSKSFPDVNQVNTIENQVTQNTSEKNSRGEKWDCEEDMALMSAWCAVNELQSLNKNKKKTSLWAQVKKLYDESQAQNPKKLGPRNEAQMKGRWKRINENAIKWIDAYRKAYSQKTSEMSLKDIDIIVFNEVMCKYPQWDLLNDHKPTPSCEVGDVGSGGNTKRKRFDEEGDYCVIYNPETPNSGGSTIHNANKRKEKCEVSQSCLFRKEYVVELRGLRSTRDSEVEVMRKEFELELKKEERKLKREERKSKKVHHIHLNTLLAKEHLMPEDERMKHDLLAMLYGKRL